MGRKHLAGRLKQSAEDRKGGVKSGGDGGGVMGRGLGVGDGKTVGHEGGEHAQARESWRRQ